MADDLNRGSQTERLLFKPSKIHGTGAFAKERIAAGVPIIEYVGERIDKAESLRRCEQNNQFIFTLDAEHDLDGNVSWNPARFFNHSCVANCDAELHEDRIWIVANRQIEAGEELTFNYGFDLEDFKNYPCLCGAAECVGYMVAEELFDEVRRNL